VFVAVTQCKTLTSAANELCLSKAAVSLALGELEKQLGHALFDRVNNRLILNHEGLRLLPLADELLDRTEEIKRLFHDDTSLHGTLRIGASNTVGNQLVPFMLSQFRQQYLHSDQTLCISNSSAICSKLNNYELDVGLIEGEANYPQLTSTPWFSDEMKIVASPQHPLAKVQNIDLEAMEGNNWLLRELGSGTREYFLKHIANQLDHWRTAFELNTTEAIINAASANLGIACLSHLSVQSALNDQRIVCLDIPLKVKRDYWLLVQKEKYQSPLIKAFIQFCLQYEHNNLKAGIYPSNTGDDVFLNKSSPEK